MKISEKNIGNVLTILGFVALGIIAIFSINGSVWSDETNSLINITRPYGTIIRGASSDCHPPLYHLMLKFFVDTTSILGINRIYLAKIFSIIPFFLLYIFVVIKTRKRRTFVVGTFLVCMCAMPNLMTYAIQIRMYSWALFFVFMTFAYAYEVLADESKKSVALCILFSILASFTHYYACVSIGFIWLSIFILMFFTRRRAMKKILIAMFVIIVMFLPWFLSITDTIKKVISGFWIQSITLNSLIGYVWFILFPNIYRYHLSGILGIFLTIAFIYSFFTYLISDKRKVNKIYVLMGVICTGGTLLFGIVASVLLAPVYQDRFIYPSLAALWLVFSVCVCSVEKKTIKNGIFILILLFGIINVSDVIGKEVFYKDNLQKVEDAIAQIDVKDCIIVSDSYHISCCVSFYNSEAEIDIPIFLWNNEADGMRIRNTFYPNLYNLEDIGTVEEIVEEKEVLFLENIGYNTDFVEQCKEKDMNVIERGHYSIEDREFVLYQISKGDKS